MPTVNIYVSKDDAEIVEAMQRALKELRPYPGESLSEFTVKTWKQTLEAVGRWPIKQEDGK